MLGNLPVLGKPGRLVMLLPHLVIVARDGVRAAAATLEPKESLC